MPRLPVKGDKNGVFEFRITLGQKERDLLETASTAFAINKVAVPAVSLMSDVSGMIVFASLLATIGIVVDLSGLDGVTDQGEVVNRIREAIVTSNTESIAAKMSGDPSYIDSIMSIFQRGLDIIALGPADRIPDNVNPDINKDLF
mgnify:CR=1 FL=1|jgi:hypothetical protein|tara:strand:- start:179 stop:613 length:435 start_codon:yes stop_codon:yes gene_type:complete